MVKRLAIPLFSSPIPSILFPFSISIVFLVKLQIGQDNETRARGGSGCKNNPPLHYSMGLYMGTSGLNSLSPTSSSGPGKLVFISLP